MNAAELPALSILVLLSLASWRLTRLLAKDSFPPIYKVRSMILKRWPDLPQFDTYEQLKSYVDFERRAGRQVAKPYWLGYLVTCMWCMSFYVTLLVVTVWNGRLPLSRAEAIGFLAVWGGTMITAKVGG